MLRLASTLIFALIFSINISHAAANTPREQIEASSAKIMKLLSSNDFHNPKTKSEVIQKLEAEVMSLFDFEAFSVRAIGPSWRKFSAAQKKDFQVAFTDLLRSSYIDTLDQYSGQNLVYVDEVMSKDKKKVEVRTVIKSGKNNFPVAFRMIMRNGQWAVYDVIIEGISMIKNYREQFRGILASSSPDELIERIKTKTKEKKEKMLSK